MGCGLIAVIFAAWWAVAEGGVYKQYGCYSASDVKSALQLVERNRFLVGSECGLQHCGSKPLAAMSGISCYCGDDARVLKNLKMSSDPGCNTKCEVFNGACGDSQHFVVFLSDDYAGELPGDVPGDTSTKATGRPPDGGNTTPTLTETATTSTIPQAPPITSPQVDPTITASSADHPPPPTQATTPTQQVPPKTVTTTATGPGAQPTMGTKTHHSLTDTSPSMSSVSGSTSLSTAGEPTPQAKSLSGGAIAGIVIGCLVGLAALGGAVAFFLLRQDRDDISGAPDMEEKRLYQPYSFGEKDPLPMDFSNPSTAPTSRYQPRMGCGSVVASHALATDQAPIAHYQEATLGRPRLSNSSLPDITEGNSFRITNPDTN